MLIEQMELGPAIDYLRRRFESLQGADWPELAGRLSRLGYWEFEDYRED